MIPNHISISGIILSIEAVLSMNNQNKRAVESLFQCGLDLDRVINSFPKLDSREIEEIYKIMNEIAGEVISVAVLKVNCM